MAHTSRKTSGHRWRNPLLVYGIAALVGVLISVASPMWQINPVWLLGGSIALYLTGYIMVYYIERARRRNQQLEFGAELGGDPFSDFSAEVLLDGVVVATLSDRVWTEMFWRDYRITPVNAEGAALIARDDLWENCRFTFRHPATGWRCDTGFCGGVPPYVRDDIVSLRGLYFKKSPASGTAAAAVTSLTDS